MKIIHRSISVGLFLAIIVISIPFVSAQAATLSPATLSRQLEFGMSGSDVTALQTFLASDITLYPQGLVTGYFGPLTKAAVIRFQAQKGLPQVGRVGPQTLAAIGNLADNTRKVGSDRIAPTISDIEILTTDSSASITWETSQGSSAIVYYDTSPLRLTEADATNGVNISGTTALESTQLKTSHKVSISNLQSDTTYNYLIYVQDPYGNVALTWPATWRTN